MFPAKDWPHDWSLESRSHRDRGPVLLGLSGSRCQFHANTSWGLKSNKPRGYKTSLFVELYIIYLCIYVPTTPGIKMKHVTFPAVSASAKELDGRPRSPLPWVPRKVWQTHRRPQVRHLWADLQAPRRDLLRQVPSPWGYFHSS